MVVMWLPPLPLSWANVMISRLSLARAHCAYALRRFCSQAFPVVTGQVLDHARKERTAMALANHAEPARND
jgi:hypothetical protein